VAVPPVSDSKELDVAQLNLNIAKDGVVKIYVKKPKPKIVQLSIPTVLSATGTHPSVWTVEMDSIWTKTTFVN
jgi:hypothetical protein